MEGVAATEEVAEADLGAVRVATRAAIQEVTEEMVTAIDMEAA